MVRIGRIPNKLQSFFRPIHQHFGQGPCEHFWALVMAIITVSHWSTIDKLAQTLRDLTHRTNHGEFLWRNIWDHSSAMQPMAFDMLLSLFTPKDHHLFFIVSDTQTLNRAKKM